MHKMLITIICIKIIDCNIYIHVTVHRNRFILNI